MSYIHVVGAGPAGSIAAISAIRHGHSVVISEEHAEPGWPVTCSGLFSAEGLQSLSRFVDYKKSIINSIKGADIYFSDQVFKIRAPDTVAYVCERQEFDATLAQRAESEGARINFNERINGGFKAECVIGADGPHSHVARHFGFPLIKRYVCAMKALVAYDVTADMGQSILKMYLSNERFPGFFGWVIPHSKDIAEFGVGVSLPGDVRKAWNELLRMHGISANQTVFADTIPMEARAKIAMRTDGRNVLLVGDAAGHTKPTTGGGVIFGGKCAAIAGKNINNPTRYELEWRTRHGPDLFLHRAIRDHLDSLDDHALASLGKKLNKMKFDDYLSEHGSMDSPIKMITPSLILHGIRTMAGLK